MKKILTLILSATMLLSVPAIVNAEPAASPTPAPQADAETGFWITTKGKKRHNSKCRFYKKTEGKPCEATEGVACRVCGG